MERERLGRASGCSNTPNWTRNDVPDLQRAMSSTKISVENGKICNQTTMRERLERVGEAWIGFGLLMRRIAVDGILSRRWKEDLGAPPQIWEQYSKEGRIRDLHIVNS